MKRSSWKLPYIHPVLFKKRILNKKSILLKIRNTLIPFNFTDKKLKIYNGIWYLSKEVASNMSGLKIGQFSFTKRCDKQIHKKKKGKKKNKK